MKPRTLFIRRLPFPALILAAAMQPASGATRTWVGGTSPLTWATGANWDTGVPGTTDTATFAVGGASTTIGTITSILDASKTIANLNFTPATLGYHHGLQINSGQTLTVSSSFSALSSDAGGGTNELTIKGDSSGVGALSIGSGGGSDNFTVGTTGTAGSNATAIVDMSGMGAFTANVTTFMVAGARTSGSGQCYSRLYLAASNTITATTVNIGNNSLGANGQKYGDVYLGQTNTINATTINIGNGRSTGTLQFQSGLASSPTLTIRDKSGGNTAALVVGQDSCNSAGGGTLDLTTGTSGVADFALSTLSIAPVSSGSPGTGTMKWAAGTVAATTVTIGSTTASTGTSSGTINMSGTATLAAGSVTLGNKVGGAAAGTLTLDGTATLKATTLQQGAGGGTSTFTWNAGTVQNTSGTDLNIKALAGTFTLTLAGSGPHTFYADPSRTITEESTALIAGAGGLTKDGSGTLLLQSANTFSGNTLITAGTLQLGNNLSLQNSVLDTSGSGVANLTGFTTPTLGGLTGGTNLASVITTGYGGITALTLNAGTGVSGTYAGAITEGATGMTLSKTGAGTQTLTGSNSYTGLTTVSVGVLNIQNNTATGTTAGGVTVTSGAALQTQNNITVGAEALTLNGTGIAADGALRNISGTNIWQGTVTLASAARINSDAGSLTFNTAANSITASNQNLTLGGAGNGAVMGTITTGTGTLTKDGAGIWTLGGANTYTGATSVTAGYLSFGKQASLYNSATAWTPSNITVASGTALALGVGDAASGYFDAAAIATFLDSSHMGSSTTTTGFKTGALLGFDTTNATAGAFTYSTPLGSIGSSSSNGLAKLGAGTLTLSAPNIYTGATNIIAGTLKAGIASIPGVGGAFGLNSAISLSNVAGAALDSTGYNTQIGSLTGGGALGGNVTLGSATLIVGADNTSPAAYAGVISGSGGSLVKIGTGTLVLSGSNTYGGTTTLVAGTLQLGDGTGGSLNSGSSAISFNGGPAILNVRALDAGSSLTLSGVTYASGDTTVKSTYGTSGNALLTLSGLAARSAGVTNNYAISGGTNGTTNKIVLSGASTGFIDQGTFFGGNNYAWYDSGAYVRGINWGSDSGSTTVAGGASIASTNYAQTTGAVTAQANATFIGLNIVNSANSAQAFTLGTGVTLTTNGILRSGNGGSGSTTTISGGTGIQAATNAELVIRTDQTNDLLTINIPILANGSSSLTKTGVGTLTLSAVSTYTGGTTIDAGSLTLSTQKMTNPLGSGAITIDAGASFSPNGGTFSNAVNLNGGTITNGNSYPANFNGNVTLSGLSTLDLATSGNMVIAGNISGAGGIVKIGAAGTPAKLNGANTYTGITNVSAGVLEIKSSLYNNDTSQWTPANIIVAGGATLMVNVGGGSDFTASQAGTLFGNLSTGVNNNGLKAGSSVGFDTTNGNANISANLTDSSGTGGGTVGLVKLGANTLTLSGTNSYSGKTYNRGGGTLSVSSFNSVATNAGLGTVHSASSSLGAPTTVANGTIDLGDNNTSAGVGLIYTGSGETTDRVLNFAAQGTNNHTINQSGSGLLKFTSSFTINTNTSQGLTLTGSTSGAGEIAGSLPMVAGTLTKSGTGTWTLSGTSTYSGATSVTAGKLVVSGSIANTAVTVSNTGTILASGATGTIGNSVTLNSGTVLAPGDAGAAGTATVVGATTFNNGSIFSWDINSGGTGYDKLVTASVAAAGSPVFRIVAADASFSNTFWSTSRTWTNIVTTDGTTAISNWANLFTTVSLVNSSLTPITPTNGSFSLVGNTLTWTAVPEPSGAIAGLLLGAGLLRRRRAL